MKRNLLYGLGINDAHYVVYPTINGRRVMCPFYGTWRHMFERSYSDKYHLLHPTYKGCSVVEEWHTFSNFRAWMQTQDWEGKELDKDLKVFGNKVYGPDTCMFIPSLINTFINVPILGKSKLGVTYYPYRTKNKYAVKIRKYGKHYHVGVFNTEDKAHEAYNEKRKEYMLEVAENSEPKIKKLLLKLIEGQFK